MDWKLLVKWKLQTFKNEGTFDFWKSIMWTFLIFSAGIVGICNKAALSAFLQTIEDPQRRVCFSLKDV